MKRRKKEKGKNYGCGARYMQKLQLDILTKRQSVCFDSTPRSCLCLSILPLTGLSPVISFQASFIEIISNKQLLFECFD